MVDPQDPEVTRVIPQPQATIIVFAGVAIGLGAVFLTDVVGGPWYLRGVIGTILGSVLGGVLLGLAAAVRARLLARAGE